MATGRRRSHVIQIVWLAGWRATLTRLTSRPCSSVGVSAHQPPMVWLSFVYPGAPKRRPQSACPRAALEPLSFCWPSVARVRLRWGQLCELLGFAGCRNRIAAVLLASHFHPLQMAAKFAKCAQVQQIRFASQADVKLASMSISSLSSDIHRPVAQIGSCKICAPNWPNQQHLAALSKQQCLVLQNSDLVLALVGELI